VLLALLVAGWLYRDRLLEAIGRGPRTEQPAEGRPSAKALSAARAKVDSLGRGRADSVVLDASQAASLIGAGLDPMVRGQIDSARLPRELLGPLAIAVHDREPVSASGPIRVAGPGRGEWTIERLDVRGVPMPRDAVQGLLARALGRPTAWTLPVRLPPGVRDMRIRLTGAVLFGARTQ
jgi:hypothetical protein